MLNPRPAISGRAQKGNSDVHWALEDVDGDGDFDLIFQFRTQDTGIGAGAMSAHLRGIAQGKEFEGYDSILIVGPKKK